MRPVSPSLPQILLFDPDSSTIASHHETRSRFANRLTQIEFEVYERLLIRETSRHLWTIRSELDFSRTASRPHRWELLDATAFENPQFALPLEGSWPCPRGLPKHLSAASTARPVDGRRLCRSRPTFGDSFNSSAKGGMTVVTQRIVATLKNCWIADIGHGEIDSYLSLDRLLAFIQRGKTSFVRRKVKCR